MSNSKFTIEIYHKPHTKIFRWGYQLYLDLNPIFFWNYCLTKKSATKSAKREVKYRLNKEEKERRKSVIETKERFDYDG